MDKQIIQEYQSGVSILQLSKKYPVNYRYIQKLLRTNNITIRGGRKKKELCEQDLKQFKIDFVNGETYDNMSKKYQLAEETLRNMAISLNLQRKNHNKINKNIISDYFEEIDSPEKAYWLGLLFTDGCVDNQKGCKRIRLSLQAQDEDILIKFKETLNIETKLINDDHKQGSHLLNIEFVDHKIFDDLNRFGIIPRKTYETEHLPLSLLKEEYIPSFLLGMFDGDGCLTYSSDFSKDVSINLTSFHQSIVKEYQQAIDRIINKEKHNKVFKTTAWHAQWRGRNQVLKILDTLYANCPIHLNRKYNKYLQLKNSILN